MRLGLLSNVNLDLLDSYLKGSFELYRPDGYGQWVQESFVPSQGLVSFDPEAIMVLLNGTALLEGVAGPAAGEVEIDATLAHLERLAGHFPTVPIYASTIDIRPVKLLVADQARPEPGLADRFATGLGDLTQRVTNLHLFDLGALIAEQGRRIIYSDKMWYLGSMPYSTKGLGIIADAITERVNRPRAIRRKVLILDLDNTLWGGVLGEDGLDGIQLSSSLQGAAYRDAQLRIKELSALGVLLAVASKNDEDLVRQVLREHPQMVLREDDFISIMANWQPKAENIAALAESLNLGLGSFVFLDDNPVEQEAVRQALPEVGVVEFPRDLSRLPARVSELAGEYFFVEQLTGEDTAKKEQYQTEARRLSAKSAADSMEDYLASLEIRITLGEVSDEQVARTAQLTGKTNQFNLVTARYSPEELLAYRSDPNRSVYVASVTDRFGDYGLVLVLMVSRDGAMARIDNLLMSCRVMGRHIEDSVLNAVEDRLAAEGITAVSGRYLPTQRNTPVRNLLDRLGFDRISESEQATEYERSLGSEAPNRVSMHPVEWVN